MYTSVRPRIARRRIVSSKLFPPTHHGLRFENESPLLPAWPRFNKWTSVEKGAKSPRFEKSITAATQLAVDVGAPRGEKVSEK